MPFNRTSSWLAIGLLVLLLAGSTFGQGPLGMQIFAPADVSTYGGDIEPNEGYFFQFDGLFWTISTPKVTPVGFPGLTREVFYGPAQSPLFYADERPQSNSLDTSLCTNMFTPGARYEFGRVEDRNGWFCSIVQMHDQEQDFRIPAVDIVFQDTPWGPVGQGHLEGGTQSPVFSDLLPLPTTLYDVGMNHSVDTWSVELMYLHRFQTCHNGGTFEFFAGPRYLEFNDNFGITVGSSGDTARLHDFLRESSWFSSAQNHIIGGELGTRWFKKQGRWMLSTEGRFLAGLNCQNIHQTVNLGPHLTPFRLDTNPPEQQSPIFSPWLLGPSTSTYDAAPRVWTPGVELRVEARYQITSAISFHAGWTGLWLDGIARGDAVIDYTLQSNGQVFGIDLTRNRESVFVNGLTMGFDVNR